jgi:hypothetical protein
MVIGGRLFYFADYRALWLINLEKKGIPPGKTLWCAICDCDEQILFIVIAHRHVFSTLSHTLLLPFYWNYVHGRCGAIIINSRSWNSFSYCKSWAVGSSSSSEICTVSRNRWSLSIRQTNSWQRRYRKKMRRRQERSEKKLEKVSSIGVRKDFSSYVYTKTQLYQYIYIYIYIYIYTLWFKL